MTPLANNEWRNQYTTKTATSFTIQAEATYDWKNEQWNVPMTKKGSTDFVPSAERIVVFDNDGTLRDVRDSIGAPLRRAAVWNTRTHASI